MSLDDVQQDLVELMLSHGDFDDGDLLAQAVYEITRWHREGPDRDVAIALFSALGVTRRGRVCYIPATVIGEMGSSVAGCLKIRTSVHVDCSQAHASSRCTGRYVTASSPA